MKTVGLSDKVDQTCEMLLKLYDLFLEKDALLIEVNPYAEDASGNCKLVLKFKININNLLITETLKKK